MVANVRARSLPAMPPEPETPAVPSGRIGSFWNKHAKGKGNAIMPQSMWARLANTDEVVMVHAVREGETRFGAAWFTDVELAPDSVALTPGEPVLWTTAQSKNAVRDPLMSALRDAIAEGGPMPATLETFDTDSGPGWDFAPPPADYLANIEPPF